ncbi:transposase [Streptomyces sp. NPDC127061]|uniref:transposase n=1 Tax=Streptomyces sp. NPDC127061 TaxID=3347122 RepID=UPI00364CB821
MEPLLPAPTPQSAPDRPRVPNRQVLCGILLVLHTGIQWEYLPQEARLQLRHDVSAAACRTERGRVRDQLHAVLPTKLRPAKQLDQSRAVTDSGHVRTARRGPKAVPARSTAHGRAANTTSSSMGGAFHSLYP